MQKAAKCVHRGLGSPGCYGVKLEVHIREDPGALCVRARSKNGVRVRAVRVQHVTVWRARKSVISA